MSDHSNGVSAAAAADARFIISHSGPMGTVGQQSTAAAFYAAKRSKSSKCESPAVMRKQQQQHQQPTAAGHEESGKKLFDFAGILRKCPPPAPAFLLKKMDSSSENSNNGHLPNGTTSSTSSSMGKVKVILRVANSGLIDDTNKGSFFKMDQKKRQVTLFDPSNASSTLNVSAPKMFAFDGLFTDEDPQNEVSSAALSDAINSVVNGNDGCLFCFGHASLGKTYTMIGSDESNVTLGVIPAAIAWLFRCIKEKKDKSNARFSVRVSAMEIGGPKEEIRDLLANVDNEAATQQQPSSFLPPSSKSSGSSNIFQSLNELRCPTPDKAGQFLDAALGSRVTSESSGGIGKKDSHLVYTLHVYQYSVSSSSSAGGVRRNSAAAASSAVGGVIGGRSRLHLIDFGGCERTKTSSGGITLSGLGHVILGIFNGQLRHLPFKESSVTQVLKECLGSLSCQATMIAHVSPSPSHYSETLHTTQLASRIHRMRRKKSMKSSGSSGGGSAGSGSSDEMKRLVKMSGSDLTTSTDPSSSEQSCDTVIYVGGRGNNDDNEGTDAEHPPVYIPNLNSGDHRGQMAKVLRGSTAELKSSSGASCSSQSTLERRHNSPSSSHLLLMSPVSSRHRPGSVGATPTRRSSLLNSSQQRGPQFHLPRFYNQVENIGRGGSLPRNPKGKMPLYGRVAGYRQTPTASPQHSAKEEWIQQHRISQNGGKSRGRDDWIDRVYGDAGGQQQQQQPLYGYMDDHKKHMIQQWVECQAVQMASASTSTSNGTSSVASSSSAGSSSRRSKGKRMPVSPSSSSSNKSSTIVAEPEPFAWLNEKGAQLDSGDCKVLTHFKTVETSSEDSSFDSKDKTVVVGADVHNENSVPPSPAVSSNYGEEEEERVEKDFRVINNGCNGGIVVSAPSPTECKNPNTTTSSSTSLLPGERAVPTSTTRNASGTTTATAMTEARTSPVKSISSATNNNTTATSRANNDSIDSDWPPPPPPPPTTTTTTTSTSGNIQSLDELYIHCEQLVQDLQERTSSITSSSSTRAGGDVLANRGRRGRVVEECLQITSDGNGAIDGIEIVEEIVPASGNNNHVATTDSVCQVSEEELAAMAAAAMSKNSSSCSSLENQKPLSVLDGGKLHYVNGTANNGNHQTSSTSLFEIGGLDSDGVVDKGRFDQLAKLHDLYASVSSINAKTQNHLEEKRKMREGQETKGGILASLGSLQMLNSAQDEKPSQNPSRSPLGSLCDINSLCSEPARMLGYGDFLSRQPSGVDLNVLDNNDGGLAGLSISLSDLGFFEHQQPNNGRSCFYRSDSPILEGIDQELAKYAKLKDLEQAYQRGGGGVGGGEGEKEQVDGMLLLQQRQQPQQPQLSTPRRQRQQHQRQLPDGASNPDLNHKVPRPEGETSKPPLACFSSSSSLQRRSPGTGQSSSSSNEESAAAATAKADATTTTGTTADLNHGQKPHQQHQQQPPKNKPAPTQNLKQQAVKANGVSSSKPPPPPPLPTKELCGPESRSKRTDNPLSSSPSNNKKNNEKSSPAKSRVPKFSRLFKISRSPLKIGGGKEDNSSKKRLSRTTETTTALDKECSSNDKKGNNGKKASKNARGTSSSSLFQQLRPTQRGTTTTSAEQIGTSATKQGTPASRQQQQQQQNNPTCGSGSRSRGKTTGKSTYGANATTTGSFLLPSPYSYPAAAKSASPGGVCETSSNDSGHSGSIVGVRLRGSAVIAAAEDAASAAVMTSSPNPCQGGRGALLMMKGEKRALHCKSSGYESFGLEQESTSERDSIDSPTKPEANGGGGKSAVEVVPYEEDFVKRLDTRGRFCQVKELKQTQEQLKLEMQKAKERIAADPNKWSYELHLESAAVVHQSDQTDPSFVEAFGKETQILQKRIDACKAHVNLVTCFDVGSTTTSEAARTAADNCCTTHCDHPQNIVLSLEEDKDASETDIV